jgi:hypothetical protein
MDEFMDAVLQDLTIEVVRVGAIALGAVLVVLGAVGYARRRRGR